MATSHDDQPNVNQAESPAQPLRDDDLETTAAQAPGSAFDLDDFDDEFDDDFEAEVAGEYELDDDEYARQLVDMVDFEIEGLTDLGDDESPGNDDANSIDADNIDDD